jgi:hypothetical protein
VLDPFINDVVVGPVMVVNDVVEKLLKLVVLCPVEVVKVEEEPFNVDEKLDAVIALIVVAFIDERVVVNEEVVFFESFDSDDSEDSDDFFSFLVPRTTPAVIPAATTLTAPIAIRQVTIL